MKAGKLLGWIIGIAIFAAVVVPNFKQGRQDATDRQAAALTTSNAQQVTVEITSDPPGAKVVVNGQTRGTTPMPLTLDAGRSYTYTVTATEPYADYSLYKPFAGTLNATENATVSVWIERTTADEQAAQRRAAEAARALEQQAACRRRLANVSLIVEDWHWSRSYGYAIAEGRVTNRTNTTLRNIMAVVEYETSSGQFITSDDSLLDYQDLLPGQTTPFKVYTNLNPAMSSASLSFREMFGGQVGAVKRANLEC